MSAPTTSKAGRRKGEPAVTVPPNVTSLHLVKTRMEAARVSQYQSDLIDVLGDLLDRAKAGQLVGLVWCHEESGDEHRVGIVGSYEKTRMSSVGAAAMVSRLVDKAVRGDLQGFIR